jgi:hypothetical protein
VSYSCNIPDILLFGSGDDLERQAAFRQFAFELFTEANGGNPHPKKCAVSFNLQVAPVEVTRSKEMDDLIVGTTPAFASVPGLNVRAVY